MRLIYIRKAENFLYAFQEHSHIFWEIILIREGSGEEIINGKSYPVKAGNILCIPPNTPHASVSDKGMKEFCLAFEDFMPIGRGDLLVLQDDWNDNAYHLMQMILETIRRAPVNAQLLTDALGNTLYQLLTAYADEGSGKHTAVAELKTQLMDNLNNPDFDIGQAMDAAGFSRGHLRRVFKEVTGMTPLAWMNYQRIESAKRYFRQYPGIYTVKEVGVMVGITDPYYFSKMFKKVTGVSPALYVKQFESEKMGKEIQTDIAREMQEELNALL